MATRRASTMIVLLLLAIVPTPACSQCTTCNQQPSQIYYNSQAVVQPSNQARPGQFQPPTSVSRNQQIYVWYGQPNQMQNQLNQALGVNMPQNGVPQQQQQQYNPNGGYNPNNQQPVMYNNINRDQPNYANQQFNPNPSVQQGTSRPNTGFVPPMNVPSTAFPYSTTTPAYNTAGSLAPLTQNFDTTPNYPSTTSAPFYGPTSTSAPYYGPTSTMAPPPVTEHASTTPGPDVFPSSSSASSIQFAFVSSSTPALSSTPNAPSPYLAEGFTPTPSPPPSSNTNDSLIAPLPVVFPPSSPVSSSSVNVVPVAPSSLPQQSNTVIISQTISGPATAPSGLSQAPNQVPPNQATFTQTVIGTNQVPSGTGQQSSTTFTQTIVGTNQATGSLGQGPDSTFVNSNQASFSSDMQPGFSSDSMFAGSENQDLVGGQPGSTVTPLPVVFPSPVASNQPIPGSNQIFGPNPSVAGPAFQPNPSAPSQSRGFAAQSSSAFVQDSGPAVPRPVGSAPDFQPSPTASSDFAMQPNPSVSNQFQSGQYSQISQPQPGYNPALVTSQTAPVSNQYDPAFAQQQQQQGPAAALAAGGGSAAVAAAALAAAAAAGNSSSSTLRPPTTITFAYSTQFDQGTPMPTLQPAPTASQLPLVTGSMQPVSSTPAYSPSPSTASPSSSSSASPSPSTSRVPSSTTPFPYSSSMQPEQQQQVLQPAPQLQQQPFSSTQQPAQVYSGSTTAFPYSTQFDQGTPMPTQMPYSSTAAPTTSTMSPSTTSYYPSTTTTMAPPTSTFPCTSTTTASPAYTASPSTMQQPQFGSSSTMQPSQQQLQQQPYVLGNPQQPQQPQTSTFAPYTSTQGPQSTTAPVQIGYNPAGQPQYGNTNSQAPFTSSPSTAYPLQSTTPYGSQYPITGTPVNQGAVGVNNVQGSSPYYPSTTPSPQQPFYSPSTQPPYTTTASPVYQIGQGIPGNTVNPQQSPYASASTYSPYAVGSSTLGTQVLYDPSTGLSTANGMNTMYGKYTTMEPGSQMMRDVPITNGEASLSLMAGIAALVFLF